MTTQFSFTEPSTAILAACPRPRAFAAAAVATVLPATFVPSALAGAEWPRTAVIAASVRRPGSVAERPAAGYRAARVLVDSVRVEFGGHGSAGTALTGGNGMNSGNGMTSKQQDKQHLTTRREPVTWRPPR